MPAIQSKPSTTSTSVDHTNKPSWNCSPLTRQAWIDKLPAYLALKDTRYKSLWSGGFALEKGTTVITSSPTHSKDHYHGNIALRDFDDVTSNKYILKGPPHTRVTSNIPDEDKNNYKERPAALDAIDSALLEDILDTITNVTRAKQYRKKAANSGISMIILIHAENASKKATQSSYHGLAMRELERAGLEACTSATFDDWVEAYEQHNKQTTQPLPPDALASIYYDLIYSLGTEIRANLREAMRDHQATGDYSKTIDAIHQALDEEETNAGRRDRGNARAAGGLRDPNKTRTRTPPVWTKGKHEKCSICNGKGKGAADDGEHLRIHCPELTEEDKEKIKAARAARDKRKAARGGARIGAGQRDADDSDDSGSTGNLYAADEHEDADIALASLYTGGR